MNKDDGYRLLAGKCKAYCEAIIAADPAANWTLVRGHYFDWGEERGHWWLKSPDGVIYDPTREQFPSGGVESRYTEFNGMILCANCSEVEVTEEKAIIYGNYGFCSDVCAMRFVGL